VYSSACPQSKKETPLYLGDTATSRIYIILLDILEDVVRSRLSSPFENHPQKPFSSMTVFLKS
jgi:hypothetical protein